MVFSGFKFNGFNGFIIINDNDKYLIMLSVNPQLPKLQ